MSSKASASPNDRINIAVIGLGNRGTQLTEYFLRRPEVEVSYLCDVDRSKFTRATALVEEARDRIPKRVQDFRQVLADKDVDAVVIATGHNWHALATIWACQAGKDVYVEKPMSLTLSEGRKMVEAARKYERVVQVGSQTMSAAYFRDALDYARSGKLGEISLVRSQLLERMEPRVTMPKPGDQAPVPKGLDWDMWCRPAPLRPYWPGNWWWRLWDYSNGGMTDHAAHHMGMARAFLNSPYPKSVSSTGGRFHLLDGSQTPDTQYAMFQYEKQNIVYQGGRWLPYINTAYQVVKNRNEYPDWLRSNRVEVLGSEAMLVTCRIGAGWQVFGREDAPIAGGYGRPGDEPHIANFLECVRTRQRPNADVEETHQAMTLCHLMNTSLRLGGRQLTFDAATESFVNDDEANRLLKREGRTPWLIPDKV